ncbi:MAG: cupin domain-containing protein [Acidimicrobiales bacterium]
MRATTPARTTPAGPNQLSPLARCVGDVPTFIDHHWSQRPLLRAGADGDADAFADLFSIDAVDTLISSLPRLPEFRLVRDGTPVDPSRYCVTRTVGGKPVPGVGDPARIHAELASGATIVMQSLQRTWPPLARFCRLLELELTHPVQANAYVTPPGERGLGVHHDTHDVFVLHLAGRKRWQVYEPVVDHPLSDQRWSAGTAPTPMILDTELRPGDCLYMPRGFPHAAWSQDETAAHLTIGLLAFSTQDVLAELLRRTHDAIAFRRSLRPGFASDAGFVADVDEIVTRLGQWLATLDTAVVAEAVSERFWATRPPVLPGQLGQLARLDGVHEASVVRRRETAVCRLSVRDDMLVAVLGPRRLEMPAALESVVRRLVAGPAVCLADLDDDIDEKSRTVLARRLIREGVIELVG